MQDELDPADPLPWKCKPRDANGSCRGCTHRGETASQRTATSVSTLFSALSPRQRQGCCLPPFLLCLDPQDTLPTALGPVGCISSLTALMAQIRALLNPPLLPQKTSCLNIYLSKLFVFLSVFAIEVKMGGKGRRWGGILGKRPYRLSRLRGSSPPFCTGVVHGQLSSESPAH